MKILQLLPTLAYGDAVGNDVIALQHFLMEKGYETKIYAENIDPRIHSDVVSSCFDMPRLAKEDILLYHFSTGSKAVAKILRDQDCRRIMIYHNITPKEYFQEYNPDLMRLVESGRQELRDLKECFECCLADSEYNKQDLIREGYDCPIGILPILIPFEDYRKEPDADVLEKYRNDGTVNILFTGRIAPNKKQEDVIRAFAYYHAHINPDSRLFIVGNYQGMELYYQRLVRYADALGISERVLFTGHIPFSGILAYYRLADLFLCMSDHEGFCVPLVEAMSFSVPILACRAAAIPDTLGGAGMIVDDRNPVMAAEFMGRMLKDGELQDLLRRRMKMRLEDFSYENTTKLFERYLDAILNGRSIEEVTNSSQRTSGMMELDRKAAAWKEEILAKGPMPQMPAFDDIPVEPVVDMQGNVETGGLLKKSLKLVYRGVYAFSPGLANSIRSIVTKPKRALENYRETKRLAHETAAHCEGILRHCDALQKCCEALLGRCASLEEQCAGLAEQCNRERAAREQLQQEQQRLTEFVRCAPLEPVMEDDGLIAKKRYLPEGICYPAADMEQFYFDLSNAFRGPEEAILAGNEMFLPFLAEAAERNPGRPILDFGCGRGELLDLMARNNIAAIGVDMNKESARPAIDKGHRVVIGDAMEYIRQQEDGALGGIAMIMVSEHVPFDQMFEGIFLFAKKIAAGGSLLINTINPYCFRRMGNFRLDPSHINFLPPEIYKLVMEMAGLHDIRILWSVPIGEDTFHEDVHSRYENVTIVGYR